MCEDNVTPLEGMRAEYSASFPSVLFTASRADGDDIPERLSYDPSVRSCRLSALQVPDRSRHNRRQHLYADADAVRLVTEQRHRGILYTIQ